jgi:hypothetical protein
MIENYWFAWTGNSDLNILLEVLGQNNVAENDEAMPSIPFILVL